MVDPGPFSGPAGAPTLAVPVSLLIERAMNRPALGLLALLAACAPSPGGVAPAQPKCPSGQELEIRDALYFGLTIPGGGEISASDWEDFLSGTVTPAFPSGLTVLEAKGQWREASGLVRAEPTRVVVLYHENSPDTDESIRGIIGTYKERFRQEAVLWERTSACVGS